MITKKEYVNKLKDTWIAPRLAISPETGKKVLKTATIFEYHVNLCRCYGFQQNTSLKNTTVFYVNQCSFYFVCLSM